MQRARNWRGFCALLALVAVAGCQMVDTGPRPADPDEEPELICGNC